MKKQYETPEISLLILKENDFLNVSGDATGSDGFNDGYGESFS